MTTRRIVTALLLALAVPLAAEAQQAVRVYRIGVLEAMPASANTANLAALRQALQERGYTEGRNLLIEYRSVDGHGDDFPDLAAELVDLRVDIILTRGTLAVMAARNASRTLPIVMVSSGDPLGVGVIASLAHPGGNVTGLTSLNAEAGSKRLELFRTAVPGMRRIAILGDMGNPAVKAQSEGIERGARTMGLHVQLLDVRRTGDLTPAFETATKQRADGVIVSLSTVALMQVGLIAELAMKRRLPMMAPAREFVDAGGLMAYGVSYPDLYRRAATFVDRILKGAKPADPPVEQPTKFELVISLHGRAVDGLRSPPRRKVFGISRAINEQKTTVFVSDQNVNMGLSIAHRLSAPDGRGRPHRHRRRAPREAAAYLGGT